MNRRQTSIDCYNAIKENGLLSKRRMEVYEILFRYGDMTANEIVRKSKAHYPHTNPSSFNARLSELKKYGVIIEVGEKKDIVSNNNCYIWGLTDRIPKDIKISRSTKKSRVNDALNSLRQLYKTKTIATDEDWKSVYDLIKRI
jgi:hypothetical protein